jgi:hypothetical protein
MVIVAASVFVAVAAAAGEAAHNTHTSASPVANRLLYLCNDPARFVVTQALAYSRVGVYEGLKVSVTLAA